MRLEYQIITAFAADLVLGDPRWLPHPVRAIARLASALETPLRRIIPNARTAGILTVMLVLAATGGAAIAVTSCAAYLHPALADVVAIILLYTCLAGKDLSAHSGRVYQALASGDLPSARSQVAMLVGRDTQSLDESGVVRAAVESVAENLVDGVSAPLFFAMIGGPVGAMVYKAINTLDSTFGYKNDRYLYFGWAAARLDDVANYLPARLTVPFMVLAAAILRLRPRDAWQICRRDGRKHPSPNSGLAEGCAAGALGIQLGGVNYYFGEPSERPRMGEPRQPIAASDILLVNRLMLTTAVGFLAVIAAIRLLFIK